MKKPYDQKIYDAVLKILEEETCTFQVLRERKAEEVRAAAEQILDGPWCSPEESERLWAEIDPNGLSKKPSERSMEFGRLLSFHGRDGNAEHIAERLGTLGGVRVSGGFVNNLQLGIGWNREMQTACYRTYHDPSFLDDDHEHHH